MLEIEAEKLREERRAKMKEIKENLTNGLWRDGVTSAPNVREVDEFHEELTAAERRKRTAEKVDSAGHLAPKQRMTLTQRKNEKVREF